jgi:hypothetical protein
MKRQHEPWRDEMDIARITADRRNIVTGWIVVFVMIALGAGAPAIAPLMAGGRDADGGPVRPSPVLRTRRSFDVRSTQPGTPVVR